ncbi:unnamed protein product [Rhodiola kirilowii]
MSSLIQKINRASAEAEASCTNIVGIISTVARNIVTDISRAVNQGISSFKTVIRHNNTQCSYPLVGSTQLQVPQQSQAASVLDDHSAFLACFEQQHGTLHPFFYTCSFEDGMKLARDELKFMFMYLHSPLHPFVHSFCRETLCCEVVVQFLDANFVSWGGVAEWGEGVHMCSTLKPNSFPFCALIAPSADNSISVLQQIEGPVSADELVEILTRTIEEQGSAFGRPMPENAEKMSNDREHRKHQDAALLASLKTDKDKDHVSRSNSPLQAEASSKLGHDRKQKSTVKSQFETESDTTASIKEDEITKILIRFPDGNKREQSFKSTDKIEQLYWFIDSLALPGLGNYQLVSGVPRRVYGVEEMEMSLENADLHPRASLFLELL